MGWTTLHRERGISNRDWVQENVVGDGGTVLAASTIGRAVYCAVQAKDSDEVWGLVVIQQWGNGYHNYGYKPVSEDMGPVDIECPAHILDLLTPTESEWALEWRERCRAMAARPRVRKGDGVHFAEPIRFANGDELADFIAVDLRRNLFCHQNLPSFQYRISGWRRRAYTVDPGIAV